MVERMEEMSRMREHMMTETDKDDNKLISLEEFLAETQDKDFDTEEPWKVGSRHSCTCRILIRNQGSIN